MSSFKKLESFSFSRSEKSLTTAPAEPLNLSKLPKVYGQLGYREVQHPIIFFNDHYISPQVLLSLLEGELTELEGEFTQALLRAEKAGGEPLLGVKLLLELADVLVFTKAIKASITGSRAFDFTNVLTRVNGQFKGDFQSLREQTVNILEGDLQKNLDHLFTEIFSFIKLFPASIQEESLTQYLLKKNELNRLSEYFQFEDGMLQNEIPREELLSAKYRHVNSCLRTLRTFINKKTGYELTLQPWMTEFFKTEILDWKNSPEAIRRFEEKIPLWIDLLRAKRTALLQKSKVSLLKEEKAFLDILLRLTGAITVPPNSEEEELQAFLQPLHFGARQSLDEDFAENEG